jgi:4-hydroxy-3-polyprenylbenzoate decarboxylase
VAVAAVGAVLRELWTELPKSFQLPRPFENYKMVMPGVLAVEVPQNIKHSDTPLIFEILEEALKDAHLDGLPLMVLCNDADFTAKNINNFVWITFTRSNPSHDIYGINSFTENKHWGCRGPLIIDARIKPHHAPVLEKDPEVEKLVDRMGERGGSLYGII